MGPRPLLALAAGWVLVVVAVASVTFVVVDRAGRGVGQASAARTIAPQPTDATGLPVPPTPSAEPNETEPGEAETPEAEPTRRGTPTEASTTTPAPRATPTRAAPTSASPPTARPASSRTASFSTAGGTVVATCAGTALSLDSITPLDGWRFETSAEDGGLEVHFKPRSGERDEVEIVVRCVKGAPARL